MAFNTSRMTVYALISAIEDDLRSLIRDYLTDSLTTEEIISEELRQKAKLRLEKDLGFTVDDLNLNDLIGYFDLADTYQFINSKSQLFPEHIASLIKSLTKEFEKVVPIRNRVMHVRPLDYTDLPMLAELTESLIQTSPQVWKSLDETIQKLKDDPTFVLGLEIESFDQQFTNNHNLPLPDFDETGLIGRDDEVNKIKELCIGGFPVISILGEGGIGKTSIALKVAYELLDDKNSPFDAIVWVSSKTTQITVNEIQEIKGAIDDSLGVIQAISDQVVDGKSPKENIEEIKDYLSTFRIALFIDNLETILDENIKLFVSSLPLGSKIIITSRIGLGAYEYPVKLNGITESHGSQLLRLLAKLRGVEILSKSEEKILRQYVNRMHRNPSYIKWFVSSIQTGKRPEEVLQNSDLFLEFCMSNVYDYLSPEAKVLTTTLQCAPGYLDMPELAYLTDFDSYTLQKALQELLRTNMLSESSSVRGASLKNSFQISELSRAYLRKHHKPSATFQKKIREKKNKLNSLFEEQIHRQRMKKYSFHNIQFRDKSDRVVVKMLQDALKALNDGRHSDAYTILDEARRLSPEYSEVARILALFYVKTGSFAEAREQYELAITLAPDSPQLYFWFGRFLLREEENTEEAYIRFSKAAELDPESLDVQIALARCEMFKHEFDNAESRLSLLNGKISESDGHLHKIYLTTGLQILYRRADDLSANGNISEAIRLLMKMRDDYYSLPRGYQDIHIRQRLPKCEVIFTRLRRANDPEVIGNLSVLENWVREEGERR